MKSISISTRVALAVLAMVSLAARAEASYFSDVMAQPSLLDYWRLGESSSASPAADAKGSFNGTYTNTGGLTLGQAGAIAGDPNTAAKFSGTAYVNVPNSTALNNVYSSSGAGLTALTLAAWIDPTSVSGLSAIISRWGGGAGAGDQFIMYTLDGKLGITVSGASNENGIAAGTINTGVYAFVVGTWDSSLGAYQLYINGSLVGTGNQANPGLETSTRPLEIGAQDNNSSRYFQGTIDEPAIFSSVLSGAEILQLYNDGITAADNVPVPEPSSLWLSSLGAIGMLLGAWRTRVRRLAIAGVR